jgi:hypothetical protein
VDRNRAVVIVTDERIHAYVIAGEAVLQRGTVPLDFPAVPFGEFDADALASAIRDSLVDTPACGGRLVLVIPAHWAFVDVLPVAVRHPSTQSLAYTWEPNLPIPLEELTCAFAHLDEEHVLAAALPTTSMLILLSRLARHGVEVTALLLDAVEAATPDAAPSCWTRIASASAACRETAVSGRLLGGGATASGSAPDSAKNKVSWTKRRGRSSNLRVPWRPTTARVSRKPWSIWQP